ncbi:bifunctional 2-polyprenyl-6-hydroxyphenol methylase/3-demethylubiquinol 3-O-methyltransferase UbiG [Mitsuaria sp. 7]|uniref:class I SAM-dependent methyltransferase n=1 Tax=Mitsuaria sp. 7 TaxID=1658665 RepID=UPI00082CEDC8|nr:class I SAM-dependent methyltransferase [Mitsuaria sp. 7]
MDAKDPRTDDFYRRYADRLVTQPESTRSAMLPVVEAALPRGSRVLDVGAGAGRDVAGMLAAGLDAYGVEPSEEMRARALVQFPALAGRLRDGALPGLGQPFADVAPEGFDGVVCSAVLMHVGEDDLQASLAALASTLRRSDDGRRAADGTVMLLALPEQLDGTLVEGRDVDGRRFTNHAPKRVEELLAPLGFSVVAQSVSDAVLSATGTRWHTLTLRV